MEKHAPHYILAEIQAQMVDVQDMNLTVSARTGIPYVEWYRRMHWNGCALYIKFQRAGEYFVVSFKEL